MNFFLEYHRISRRAFLILMIFCASSLGFPVWATEASNINELMKDKSALQRTAEKTLASATKLTDLTSVKGIDAALKVVRAKMKERGFSDWFRNQIQQKRVRKFAGKIGKRAQLKMGLMPSPDITTTRWAPFLTDVNKSGNGSAGVTFRYADINCVLSSYAEIPNLTRVSFNQSFPDPPTGWMETFSPMYAEGADYDVRCSDGGPTIYKWSYFLYPLRDIATTPHILIGLRLTVNPLDAPDVVFESDTLRENNRLDLMILKYEDDDPSTTDFPLGVYEYMSPLPTD